MKSPLLTALVAVCIPTLAISEEIDDNSRQLEIASRYNALEQMAAVCVTDPCPVSRSEITYLGQNFETVRVALPQGHVDYILIESENNGRGKTYACFPDNYVEIVPNTTCYPVL